MKKILKANVRISMSSSGYSGTNSNPQICPKLYSKSQNLEIGDTLQKIDVTRTFQNVFFLIHNTFLRYGLC